MDDTTKHDSILGKIRKLLERANHPRTPAGEADSCRARAEALMLKYKIEEASAVKDGTSSLVPVWRTIVLHRVDSDFSGFYSRIAGDVIHHVGARAVMAHEWEDGVMMSALRIVGYSSDLDYAEMILTSAMLEFSKRLEPKYDPELSDAQNVYAMRTAGMERNRIAALVYGGWETVNEMKAKTRKVTKVFKEECERLGEDPSALIGRGNSVKTYREAFAHGFCDTLATRLYRLRASSRDIREGSGLVLADRYERVQEAFYAEYEVLRPDPNRKPSNSKPKGMTKAEERKFLSRLDSPGFGRGGTAANSVDLGATAGDRTIGG